MKSHSSFVLFAIVCGIVAVFAYFLVFWYPMIADQFVQDREAEQTPVIETQVEDIVEETAASVTDLSTSRFLNLKVVSVSEVSDVSVRMRTGWIENPTRSVRQSVRIHEPMNLESETYPVVIFVPGGWNNGRSFDQGQDGDYSDADYLAAEGVIVITYSPLGTEEDDPEPLDYEGFADQDGLAAIITAAKQLTNVDLEQIGVASFSYGITGAAGVLSRYPDLGVKFLVDWEGPSSREYTTVGCKEHKPMPEGEEDNRLTSISCEDESFWREREAALMIATADIEYYLRVQSIKDHVQSTYGHTLEMVSASVGNIPWVRVNDGAVNATYETDDDIPTVSESPSYFTSYGLSFILELIAAPSTAAEWFEEER
ncbi:MAG: hypothetical protein UX57_C0004G0072 [Candidatus Uhrbacteria bacterium GW2011_GWE2_46_68]|uniref:Peptidase S9 prolyl oligopeptidase catalytic domain-containing protein n=2 Tax=Candidatus Uhriibacteriota TaxID=1752732 RepID=A0A0G1SGY5_9BACT|nr:MAG: hypothetical protein UX45_C0001G0068 [Candidatus Uhrbacteria bacterium GW2011_GWF2_46_218]KKU41368.1 MAG: hypothetical protein UX57_C0004G0072 [Candidatus Uhrbacteria bacterium GW2011_GWE2_46_68]